MKQRNRVELRAYYAEIGEYSVPEPKLAWLKESA